MKEHRLIRPPKGPDTDGRGASPFDLGPLEGPGSLWKLPHPGRNPEPRSDLGQRRHSPRISITELKNLGGLSPLGFGGTYTSRLTQKSMGQMSLPVEECSLIRGRGHQRSLSQGRGPLVTGPPMTVIVGWVRVRFASPRGYMSVSSWVGLLL